jgi:hypothetical protein
LQSQRRFRARQKQHEQQQLRVLNDLREQLEEVWEERRQIELEHRMLLCRLYVGEAIFQGQCQVTNISLPPLTEPPPPTQTETCSIVKDLAVLLAIPQCPGPLPPSRLPSPAPAMPSTCEEEDVPFLVEEAGLETSRVTTPQCSGANASETSDFLIKNQVTTSAPAPAAAAPTTAAPANAVRTDSSGVDTESIACLCPPLPGNMEHAAGTFLDRTAAATKNSIHATTTDDTSIDIAAVVQSIHHPDHFVHHHSNLIEALSAASMSVFGKGAGNRTSTASDSLPELISIHNTMLNLHGLYWHTAQLKPEISVQAAYTKLPQNTEKAVEIASNMVHEFSRHELFEFRKVSREYQRQMSRVFVSVQCWMETIRACNVPEEPVPLSSAASVQLELVRSVSNLNAAVADSIKARRQMLENAKSRLKVDHMAYINLCSYPNMPDHVAVYTLLQEIAREIHNTNTVATNNNHDNT